MKRAAFCFLLPALLTTGAASAQGTVTFGGGAKASPQGSSTSGSTSAQTWGAATTPERDLLAATVPGDQSAEDREWAERDRKMNEASTLTGGVGLVHMQYAQGGAPGQFRVGFTTEFFSAGFLCTVEFPCRNPRNGDILRSDTTDHIGGRLTLSMQVTKWLEPYLATSAFANSNAANRPALLQVLGDSVLGAKAFGQVGKVLHLGGAFELWLVNGTGAVGLDGGGTSAKFRSLANIDLRGLDKPLPIRFGLNMTYVLDNSGRVIETTEQSRGTPITRIERFGLNINRTDHFDINLGFEVMAAQEKVRPFIEYGIAIPVNRQDYRCRPNNPSSDDCLANTPLAPSRLTLGSRFFPWKKGFNLLAALDIGTTGVATFIEEARPEPPWMLYLGAGWAFDTKDRPPVVKERVVEKPIAVKPPGRKIRGYIHEEGKNEAGIGGAIVSWDNHPELNALVAGPDGRFVTHELDEGPYLFGIKADGYKPGQCTTSIVRAPVRPGQPAAPPPRAPTRPGALPPSQPPQQQPQGGGDVQLDCALTPLPRVGTISGRVRDADTQQAVTATLRVIDAQKKESSAAVDPITGAFRVEQVPPGEAQLLVDADGYLAFTDKIDVKPRQDNTADILLKKRPKTANVTVGKGEIIIKQQIQFALDSAVILPESTGLLTEIADVLIKNPRIRRVEVQGHTDNSGTVEHNRQLSEDRANAVGAWLSTHGVQGDRLTAKGYGQSKPLVPNVTAGNRARNRRVQFIILEQDDGGGGPAPAPKPAKPKPKK
ncbi:MAG: OmpA family protein [Labilithrix sp.]|nr:OmpA family protein [Labilithrix sp.]